MKRTTHFVYRPRNHTNDERRDKQHRFSGLLPDSLSFDIRRARHMLSDLAACIAYAEVYEELETHADLPFDLPGLDLSSVSMDVARERLEQAIRDELEKMREEFGWSCQDEDIEAETERRLEAKETMAETGGASQDDEASLREVRLGVLANGLAESVKERIS